MMGIPALENDIMQFRLNLDLNSTCTNLYATYGVTDSFDVGVVVPLVSAHSARSELRADHPVRRPDSGALLRRHDDEPGADGDAGRRRIVVRARRRRGPREVQDARIRRQPRRAPGRRALRDRRRRRSARLRQVRGARHRDHLGSVGDFSPHANVGYAYHRAPATCRTTPCTRDGRIRRSARPHRDARGRTW